MKLQLIRNATLRLTYAGREILTDPYFAPKFSRPSFAGISPNPLVDLPCPPAEILAGAELLVLSHLHSDHFDPEAQRQVPKDLPILCPPENETRIREHGFQQVTPVAGSLDWQGITLTRTTGRHGSGTVLSEMGSVSGYIFQAPGEPLVYWAAETIWCEPVRAAIQKFKPDIILTHSGGAVWGPEKVLIIMDAAQTLTVCHTAPDADVVAIHMEALDHCTVSRADLRAAANAAGISDRQLLNPADGETLEW